MTNYTDSQPDPVAHPVELLRPPRLPRRRSGLRSHGADLALAGAATGEDAQTAVVAAAVSNHVATLVCVHCSAEDRGHGSY